MLHCDIHELSLAWTRASDGRKIRRRGSPQRVSHVPFTIDCLSATTQYALKERRLCVGCSTRAVHSHLEA